MRWIISTVCVALAFAVGDVQAGLRTGLHGYVCRGPMPAAAAAGAVRPCALPLRTMFLFTGSGRAYTVHSGADGAYRVALPAGVYRVELPFHVGVSVRRLRPAIVRVRAAHDNRLDLYLETRAP